MLVHNLPEVIVRLILKHAINSQWRGTSQWYRELNVLAVCRQWRYLALPFHHRRLFLEFNNAPISCPYCRNKSANRKLGTSNKVKTNLKLFEKTGSTKYAKVCTIILGSSLRMLELLDDMWLVFQGTLGQWGCVERVEFMLSKQFKSEGLVDLNEMPKKLADQVVAVFPGAHMLTSSSTKDNVAGIAMINSLVDVYSDRLCRLAIDVPALCKALQFPQKLTHLTLDFEYNDIMQLPHIYSSSLLYLSVNDVPEDLDWMGAFGRESGINDNILVFNNLKSLSVSYRNNMWRMEAEETGLADTHMRHTLPFKLVFPRLDTLAISMCPSRGGILQFSEFPVQGLKQLELGKTIYSDISLVDVRRPIVVDRLVICAAIMQTFDRRDPVHVYNSIMDKVKLRECGTTTIIMPFGCALTEPRQARWPNLTKLELYEPAPSSMVLDLVPRLPSLKKLSVHYLIVDTLYKLNDNDTGHSRGILSYSLRELFLDTYDTGEYESLQKTVCYMIALVPQLVVVTVPEAVRPAMRTFIANSKVTYGHLSAVII